MLEVRLSHYWYDLRLRTEDFRQPVELVPEAIKEFWTPDSYFHHAKDAKQVKVSERGKQFTVVFLNIYLLPFLFASNSVDYQSCQPADNPGQDDQVHHDVSKIEKVLLQHFCHEPWVPVPGLW